MSQSVDLVIKSEFVEQYKDGYPLLSKESIVNLDKLKTEGQILNLVDAKKKFIAKAYFGIQNKGYGWLLSFKQDEKIDSSFFENRFKEALKYREKFFSDKATTAFRMFNAEGDGVGGLSIDYFDDYYLLTWYSEGIYRFKDEILSALKRSVKYKGIYQKKRFDTKGKYLDDADDFVCGKKAPTPLIVKENNVNSLLIWYAGHGKFVNETGYWIPVDGTTDDEFTYYNINSLKAGMQSYNSYITHTLVVTDACETGATFYMAMRSADSERKCDDETATKFRSAQVFSSAGYELATDESQFTKTFAKSLKYNDDACISIESIAEQVINATSSFGSQKPLFGKISGFNDENGTFFFIKK